MPLFVTLSKVCFRREANTIITKLVTPVDIINVLMKFCYIFRKDNLLYIPKSSPRHLYYYCLIQTVDELKCIGVFTYCVYKTDAPIGLFCKKTRQLVSRNGHYLPFLGYHFVRRKWNQQIHQIKKRKCKGTVQQVFYALTSSF